LHLAVHLAAVFFFLASGCSAYLWCRQIALPRRRILRVLAGLVLWQTIQLLPVQLLAAWQIAGLLGRVTVPMVAALQAIVLAGSVGWFVRHSPQPPLARSVGIRSSFPTYLVIAAAVVACSYGVFAVDSFTSFPSGSDAMAYHLPLALRWLQTGSFALTASQTWQFSLPANAEMGMMMLLATGSESSIVFVNCLALAVLGLATYLLAQRMTGTSDRGSFAIVLLVLSIPMVEFQTFSGYVDLYGTAFLLTAFTLFLEGRARAESTTGADAQPAFRIPMLFLSAVACGISVGTKPIYYLYGAAYAVLVAVWLWRDFAKQQRTLLVALGMTAGLLLPCVFWFGRAWQATENPVFPMQVAVGRHVLLSGYAPSKITDPKFEENFVRSPAEWLVYPWTEWKRSPGYAMIPYGEGSGVGAAFAGLVPLGIVFLAYRCFLGAENRKEELLLVTLVLSCLAWWFLLNRLPRFGFPILVFACILASPLTSALQEYSQRALGILLVTALILTCGISSFVPLRSLLGRLRTRRWSRAEFYSYPSLLDRIPAGSCVLNFTNLEEKNFALAGRGLTNCVVPGFEVPDVLTLAFLREQHARYVAEIVPAQQTGPPAAEPGTTSLAEDDLVPSGESKVHWRVWKVEQP
jgi:hypothetical protein